MLVITRGYRVSWAPSDEGYTELLETKSDVERPQKFDHFPNGKPILEGEQKPLDVALKL